ncbi:MAG TPA: 3-oxoacyl-[acyl-carrier-protein] synthase III C-terminal domain-containing protein, partial [Thermogutta sp.]|nr:3-oxoacyl-[acyl-carrier-protein] synthase III C-terminal domain-containing protein [Thermogutta sp.]
HQANLRIIKAAAETIGIPEEKLYNNLDRYGNTSSASIPICLDEAVRYGPLERGDLVLLSGFGGGLSWATGILRW